MSETNAPTSAVFFTSLRTDRDNPLVGKTVKLALQAGLDKLDLKDKLVAIKIHFGEPGNLAFLRHNYAAALAAYITAQGGLPFLTDSGTLYKGRRTDAVRHLQAARENGYEMAVTGCPIIIADGLRGRDHREITVGLKHFKNVFISSAMAEADVIISLNHVKGHVETGFGGALKNIGMGGASRQGKNEMHATSPPSIDRECCVGCSVCVEHCAYSAIALDQVGKADIDPRRCVGCGQCIAVCEFDAANVSWEHGGLELGERIAEYCVGALAGKKHLHINYVMDVSPLCDCVGHNDVPIVPNLGILASTDPVAIDAASADLVTQSPALLPSRLEGHLGCSRDGRGTDKFSALYPESHWQEALLYAEKIGLGRVCYTLVKWEPRR